MRTSRWLVGLCLTLSLSALAASGCESKTEEAKEEKQEKAEGGEAAPEAGGAAAEETAPADETAAPAEETAAAEDPAERDDDYAGAMCGMYKDCYQKFDFAGQTQGKLTADVDETGKLANVTFEGDAPKPIEQCLLDTLSAHTVADYVGGTGTMTCSWVGQLADGGGMVQQSWGFERKTEPTP